MAQICGKIVGVSNGYVFKIWKSMDEASWFEIVASGYTILEEQIGKAKRVFLGPTLQIAPRPVVAKDRFHQYRLSRCCLSIASFKPATEIAPWKLLGCRITEHPVERVQICLNNIFTANLH